VGGGQLPGDLVLQECCVAPVVVVAHLPLLWVREEVRRKVEEGGVGVGREVGVGELSCEGGSLGKIVVPT